MTNSGILLSSAAFRTLSPMAQSEVLASIGLVGLDAHPSGKPLNAATPIQSSNDEDGPVELTVAMVRKLTANLSDKTITALRVIAQGDSPQFHMKDVIENTAGAETYMDMRGVWSALTRRARKIMDDSGAELIWWTGGWILDDDDNQIDHVGRVSPMTYGSLRTHFEL